MTRRLRGGADPNRGGFLQSMGLGNLFGSSDNTPKDVRDSTSVSRVIDSAHTGIEQLNNEIKTNIEEFNGLKSKMKEIIDTGKQIRQKLLKLKQERNILRNMKDVGSRNSEHFPSDSDNSESSTPYAGRLDLDETDNNNMNELSNKLNAEQSSGAALQSPGAALQSPDAEPQSPGAALRSSGAESQSSGAESQSSGAESQSSGAESQSPGAAFQSPGAAFQSPDAKSQSPGAEFQSSAGTDATASSSPPIVQPSNTSTASAPPSAAASQVSSSSDNFVSVDGSNSGGTKRRRRYAYRRRSLRR